MKTLSLVIVVALYAMAQSAPSQGKAKTYSLRRISDNLKMTYDQALKYCQTHDDQLSLYYPRSNTTNAELYNILITNHWKRMWIGVKAVRASDGSIKEWLSVDNDKAEMSFWGPLEPNNYKGHDEQCVEIRLLDKNTQTLNWNDAPCERLNNFLCQITRR